MPMPTCARWRNGDLNAATRELIDVVRREGVEGARLLDIGAGVGAVHVALLEAGAATAIDVDASRDYLAAARTEAERRGLGDRIEYRYGDVVELAPDLPPADIVTLDSVVCCYRDLEALLAAATRSRPRLLGLTYPRDVWWMRALHASLQPGPRGPPQPRALLHPSARAGGAVGR